MTHPPARPWRRRLTLMAAVAAVLALAAVPMSASAGDHHNSKPAPTIVLVHGAWADGSSWNAVTSRLVHAGYTVRVPPNPLRSLPGDSTTIRDFLSTLVGPIVLVGHSYGGAVITNAATGNPNVKALVYVDAFAPAAGESIFPLAGPDSALAADPATVFDFVPYPGAPAGDVDLYLQRSLFLTSFANGVPPVTAQLLYAGQRPITFSAGSQPSGAPAWETIPSWYVLGTQDLVIPPAQQRFMATRAGSEITEVKAGHLSMVSRPAAVTDAILTAVHGTS